MDIFLFGDQSVDCFAALCSHNARAPPIVQDFLGQVHAALRREICQLSAGDRPRVPALAMHADALQDWLPRATTDPVLRPVLTVAAQIVEFLGHADPNQGTSPPHRITLGACTGLLVGAATAAAASGSLARWIPLAVHVVVIAFRLGLHTATVGETLSHPEGPPQSWSCVVQATLLPRVLADHHQAANLPVPLQAYISAGTSTSTTISGPPTTLQGLFSSPAFPATGCSPRSLPVFAPYHAPHLHHDADLDWITALDDPAGRQTVESYSPTATLISTRNGTPFESANMAGLLRDIVREILMDPLRWDVVTEEMVKLVPSTAPIAVTVFGASPLGESLASSLRATGEREVSLHPAMQSPPADDGASPSQKIAIVGMSGRFPQAGTVGELWDILFQGLDVHQAVPSDRFDISTHVDPTGTRDNTSTTPYGCFVNHPGLFDASFFSMSPREAMVTDPMQRLALVTAYEALEMAGFVPNCTPSSMLDRVGTFYGQALDDYREVNAAQTIDPFYVTGGVRPFGPGRIHYHYKFTGPSYSIDTACSSSLAAIHLACHSLRSRECDMAVAGGTNIITGSDMYAGLSRGHFLSPSGSCKTWDADADGYCRADAVGTVVLKRLEDAEADHDPILGVILASGTNHSALASSITQPHGPTQEQLYRSLLAHAGLPPSAVDYVEMHGTGTQIGDSTEMGSVAHVFGDECRSTPLYVGSIKSNVGHGEAAAGVTAVIKGLLMLQMNLIPPHVGVKTRLNPRFPPLDEMHIRIPGRNIPFAPRQSRRRRILVNNFGAAGGNTALLMEDAPVTPRPALPGDRGMYAIAVSAKSPSSLLRNKERLWDFLGRNPETSLADLSYTTTSRRRHYRHRFSTVASTVRDVQTALARIGREGHGRKPTLILAFTGQGGIYAGVAQHLFQACRSFHTDIVRFDSLARALGQPSFLALLVSPAGIDTLSTVQTQVGQVCIQMALCRLYRSWGVTPQAVIGHSLGEYAALYATGVLSASDTIFAVGRRAELMDRYCTPGSHQMLAVRAAHPTVQDVIRCTAAEVACMNGPHDVVVAGPAPDIKLAASLLSKGGIQCIPLLVPFACHSAQLDPVIQPFEMALENLTFHPPRMPLLSPLLGFEVREAGVLDARYLSRHLREPVDFVTALERSSLVSTGADVQFVELGPHPLCAGMIRSVLGKTVIPSLQRDIDSWKSMTESVASLYMEGVDVDWGQYNRDMAPSCICLPTLPAYAFDERNYWIQYRHDWALTKGRALPVPANPSGPATTSVQRVVREAFKANPPTVEFESDLSHPALREVIAGHAINQVGLCPASLFVDMALTAGAYLYEHTVARDRLDRLGLNVADMEMVSPLIHRGDAEQGPQVVRIVATLKKETVEVKFSNRPELGVAVTVYANCQVVRQHVGTARRQWQRSKHLLSARIADLQSMPHIHQLHRGMVYKLFGAVVDYSEPFQGIDEIWMESMHYEAVALVSFKDPPSGGKFLRSPYWMDSVLQPAGFVLNANETVNTSQVVYICNGWESVQMAADLSEQQEYTVYAKMEAGEGTTMIGDVYMVHKQEIIGVGMGIRFQALPRPLLQVLLEPSPRSSSLEPAGLSGAQASKSISHSSEQQSTPAPSESQATVDQPPQRSDSPADLMHRILCEELGVTSAELDPNATLAELDVDSLMSLTILGRLRESCSRDIPPTLLAGTGTVVQLFQALHDQAQQKTAPAAASNSTHRATSILLQGNLPATTHQLFLFPGGFGSSATFMTMPSIHSSLAVFGLNSPFTHCAEDFTVGISELAALYLVEVRRRQPSGPYSFLGYSVGGIIAYEACRQLVIAGETVDRLYLVDSPCPLAIPPMPPKLIQFLDSIDRFGGRSTQGNHQERVQPMGSLHITQTLASLEPYMPAPLPGHCWSPRTTLYVAKHGVNHQSQVEVPDVSERDRRVVTWLLEDRTQLGAMGDGWETLVDPTRLTIVPVHGNHFSMMREPHVREWVDELRASYFD